MGLISRDPLAAELASKALSDDKPEVRASAAAALGEMGAKDSIPLLKDALKDKDVSVVLASASALKELGDPAGYEVYYAVLTGDRKSGGGLLEDEKKMLSDPKKMAKFGFDQGIGFVPFAGIGYGAFKVFSKDDASPVQAAAARALATDPDPVSGEALIKATSDKSVIVRAAALDAIARRNDPALTARIMPAMSDEKDMVKYSAAAAVIHLADLSKAK